MKEKIIQTLELIKFMTNLIIILVIPMSAFITGDYLSKEFFRVSQGSSNWVAVFIGVVLTYIAYYVKKLGDL